MFRPNRRDFFRLSTSAAVAGWVGSLAHSQYTAFAQAPTLAQPLPRPVGVTIVGPHAGDLLAEYVLAMKHGIGLNQILGTIHIYPTLAEANKMAAGVWKREHAPQKLLAWVEKFHAWRRG